MFLSSKKCYSIEEEEEFLVMTESDHSEVKAKALEVRARLAKLPRQKFAQTPTALDAIPRLASKLDGPKLWVKRDDCTGLAFGGNKTRQLEYILGDAVDQGADVVIQGAASQSNHSRQLAAAAARIGLESVIVPRMDQMYGHGGGNFLVTKLLASRLVPVEASASISEAKERIAQELRDQGRTPYVVGMGAYRALTLASVAYVEAFIEIIEDWISNALGALPTHIYTTSQGSTQAGLQLGARLLGMSTKIVGINPMDESNEAYNSPREITSFMEKAAELLGYEDVQLGSVLSLTDYVGPAYGVPSPASEEAIKLLASNDGILLDPIYSGKGFSGLIDHIRQGILGTEDRVVFLHTGGLPALFANFSE